MDEPIELPAKITHARRNRQRDPEDAAKALAAGQALGQLRAAQRKRETTDRRIASRLVAHGWTVTTPDGRRWTEGDDDGVRLTAAQLCKVLKA